MSWNDEMRPETRSHLERMQPEEDDDTKSVSFGRIGGRNNQRGVRFVAGKIDGHPGSTFSRDYSHYVGCDEEADGGLAVVFTDRRVILTGRGLCRGERSLLRYLTDHRVAVIETVPEERDGFTPGGRSQQVEPVVYRIRVEKVEA